MKIPKPNTLLLNVRSQIKTKVLQYLGIDKLEAENRELRRHVRDTYTEYQRATRQGRQIEEQRIQMMKDIKRAERARDAILAEFSAAADFNVRDPTVVLIMRQGDPRPDMVKFYHFRGNTLEEVHRFLEHYDNSRVSTDCPPGLKSYGRRNIRGGYENF